MADTFIRISTLTFPTGTNTATFSGIPSTYTDLVVMYSVRTVKSGTEDQMSMYFNSDQSSSYKRTTLYNDYSAVYANGDLTGYQTACTTSLGNITGNTALANSFANAFIYISEYANTSKFKSVSWRGGGQTNSDTANAGYFYINGSCYAKTDAISSITFSAGNNFVSGSTATLYGITKG
jgi:hypothetical protein